MALPLDAPRPRSKAPAALVVAAMGVVFGDIGTSPLYSMQTVFSIHGGAVRATAEDVLGVISMVIWSLLLIVTLAYIGFIMRADNHGEGGILSLAALIRHKLGKTSHRAGAAVVLAIIGASLFYGDSLITPAISVMSAIEGIEVVDPGFAEYIVPLSALILTGLFVAQRWGTGKIGKAFGPVMVVWFLVLLVLGVPKVVENPSVIRALSPTYAIAFALDRPFIAFVALGAVVLAVTGVEALYADMGHFGRRPIMLGWLYLVLPALAVNYLGQGAMILDHPSTITNPFFNLAPQWARIPLVALAACATIIASQAVISGAFSVSRQATRSSLLPRLRVVQTSREQGGQIYMPTVNILLFLGVLTLVLVFRSSGNLAAAYGLSVTGTLLLELSLFLLLAHAVWKWPFAKVAALAVFVGGLEILLFGANAVKVLSGGWLPLLIAACFVVVMMTWKRGSRIMWGRRASMEGPIEAFTEQLAQSTVQRVAGLAVYPHGNPATVPLALRRNLESNHVLHENCVVITMKNIGVPHVRADRRITVTHLGEPGNVIVRILCKVGFNDSQDVPQALRLATMEYPELGFDPSEAMYMLSVFRIEPGQDSCMPRPQKTLFRFLEKFSANRTQALHLPPERTTVMGAQAEL